jgi:hypothetical protein
MLFSKMRILSSCRGHEVAQWLRHYDTRLKVADSRPDEVNDFIFNILNPSGRTRPWGLLSL